jgi:serine/threonine protein kinase
MTGRENREVFGPGEKIGKYTIEQILGQGGFGDVYLVTKPDSQELYALKTEYNNAQKKGMSNELEIFYRIKSKYVPRFYEAGRTKSCSYYVMELLGPSLRQCTRRIASKALPLNVAMLVAEETFGIIEDVHRLGIVHRDIKPSNFLLRPHSPKPLCLIDFGISKVHVLEGTVIPPVHGRFVGTARYASLNAFRKLDIGPGDDLISWFYMMCDLANGRLPWRTKRGTDKEVIMRAKEDARLDDLIGVLPAEFLRIYNLIYELRYEDRPDYDAIRALLRIACKSRGITFIGDEWKWLWNLDPESTALVPRKAGDEKHDFFDPSKRWKESGHGGCCNVM